MSQTINKSVGDAGSAPRRWEQRARFVATLLLPIGLIGWVLPFTSVNSFQSLELPNTQRQGLVVDKNGNIFVGSGFYDRIQMYDSDGRFLRGFKTSVGKGRASLFTFTIEENKLSIRLHRTLVTKTGAIDRLIVYDFHGHLITTEDYPNTQSTEPYVADSWIDDVGNRYVFRGSMFPRVVKRVPSGETSVVISTPLWLWLFQAPFPAFAFFFVSLLTLVWLINRRDRKTRMALMRAEVQERQAALSNHKEAKLND